MMEVSVLFSYGNPRIYVTMKSGVRLLNLRKFKEPSDKPVLLSLDTSKTFFLPVGRIASRHNLDSRLTEK